MLDFTMRLLSHVLVPLWLVGMAGASVVVVITVAHDMIDFFEPDNPTQRNQSSSFPS